MKKINRFISLAVVLMLLAAAAITVHKSLFNHKIGQTAAVETAEAETCDTITTLADGSEVIHTAGLPGTIGGYAGNVDLDIHITDGRITSVEALPNTETPSFFKRASVLLDSWNGETPEDALLLKVDAVTGATYTSMAIISNVNVGLNYYEGQAAKAQSVDPAAATPWKIWVALAVTLAACIVPLFVRNKVYRTVQLVANVIVLGFWCGQFLDYALILKYISSGVALPAAIVGIVMLVAAFIYPLFGRPQHYCSHVCPLGSAQELAGKICGYKIRISARTLKGLDMFRKLLWGALMLLLWADCLTGWVDLELFQAFQFRSASIGIIVAACAFIALSVVVSRPYCRFVCPTGSLFKTAERAGNS
ncbi:MAG: 4Fe-4S binding protein [Barnesiella sp.]|nr:4Fe-4S binding protein [Barnesiella sp.]